MEEVNEMLFQKGKITEEEYKKTKKDIPLMRAYGVSTNFFED
jgi:hypothetical protein